MTEDREEEPFKGARARSSRRRVPLTGPNVISTFDTPPHPDAVKAHDASIRKHLQDRTPAAGPAAGSRAESASAARERQLEHLRASRRARRRSRRCPARPRGARARARSGRAQGRATALPSWPDGALAEQQLLARGRRLGQAQPAQVAVGLALVVQARDRLLADVAALREAHRALVQPRLLGDDACRRGRSRSADARARRAGTRRPARRPARRRARAARRSARSRVGGVAEQIDADVGAHGQRVDAVDLDAARWRARSSGASPRRRPRSPPRRGPISDSRPRSSVRLCSSTS